MEYLQKAEEHLQHLGEAGGHDQIKNDIATHFQSGGVQLEGDDTVEQKSTPPADSQMIHELEEMSERHKDDADGGFVRGVSGLGFPYAEEEADVE